MTLGVQETAPEWHLQWTIEVELNWGWGEVKKFRSLMVLHSTLSSGEARKYDDHWGPSSSDAGNHHWKTRSSQVEVETLLTVSVKKERGAYSSQCLNPMSFREELQERHSWARSWGRMITALGTPQLGWWGATEGLAEKRTKLVEEFGLAGPYWVAYH